MSIPGRDLTKGILSFFLWVIGSAAATPGHMGAYVSSLASSFGQLQDKELRFSGPFMRSHDTRITTHSATSWMPLAAIRATLAQLSQLGAKRTGAATLGSTIASKHGGGDFLGEKERAAANGEAVASAAACAAAKAPDDHVPELRVPAELQGARLRIQEVQSRDPRGLLQLLYSSAEIAQEFFGQILTNYQDKDALQGLWQTILVLGIDGCQSDSESQATPLRGYYVFGERK
jgi:hypothetical protein